MRSQRNGIRFALAFSLAGFFAPKSHAILVTGANYNITFSAGWDTIQTQAIVAKYQGLGGMASMGAVPGTVPPNLDSLTVFYADSLGGHITKGKDSSLTIGNYAVKWQEFKYDSLPKLSELISGKAPFPVSLKDGSFRVYYLVSDGFVFTISGMTIVPKSTTTPYPDIEAAIKTLKLAPQTGIREITGAWGSSEMWIHDGRLGGSWFAAHRPVSIDCFNLRGSWIGSAKPSGTPGIWTLPAVDRNAFLRILLSDGSRFHLPTRD